MANASKNAGPGGGEFKLCVLYQFALCLLFSWCPCWGGLGRLRGVFWGPLWPDRAWGSALPIPGLGLFLAAQEGALLFLAPQMEGGL